MVSGWGRRVLSLGFFGFRFSGSGCSAALGCMDFVVRTFCLFFFSFFFVGPGGGGVGRRHHNRHHHQHRHLLLRQYARRCFQYDCGMTYDKYDGRTTPAGQCVQSPSAANPETWTAKATKPKTSGAPKAENFEPWNLEPYIRDSSRFRRHKQNTLVHKAAGALRNEYPADHLPVVIPAHQTLKQTLKSSRGSGFRSP